MNEEQAKLKVEKLRDDIIPKLKQLTEKINKTSKILEPMKTRVQITLRLIAVREAQGYALQLHERLQYYHLKNSFEKLAKSLNETHIKIKDMRQQMENLLKAIRNLEAQ